MATQIAAAAGFPRIMTWSVDTGDSEGPELPATRLVHAAPWTRMENAPASDEKGGQSSLMSQRRRFLRQQKASQEHAL